MSFGAFVGVFWGVFSLCEASGNQSFLFSCAFHSADAIMIARTCPGRGFLYIYPTSSFKVFARQKLISSRCYM